MWNPTWWDECVSRTRSCELQWYWKTCISNRHEFRSPTVAYNYDTSLYIQSVVFSEGVPKFILEIQQSLNFKTFHMGINVSVHFIVKDKIRILNSCSAIDEIVTQSFETAHKILRHEFHQQLKIVSSNSVGTKLYSPNVIVRAFSYFASSRSLYNRIRSDFKFPSIRTLTRITSSFSKQSDLSILANIFQSLKKSRKFVFCFTMKLTSSRRSNTTEEKSSEKVPMILPN